MEAGKLYKEKGGVRVGGGGRGEKNVIDLPPLAQAAAAQTVPLPLPLLLPPVGTDRQLAAAAAPASPTERRGPRGGERQRGRRGRLPPKGPVFFFHSSFTFSFRFESGERVCFSSLSAAAELSGIRETPLGSFAGGKKRKQKKRTGEGERKKRGRKKDNKRASRNSKGQAGGGKKKKKKKEEKGNRKLACSSQCRAMALVSSSRVQIPETSRPKTAA